MDQSTFEVEKTENIICNAVGRVLINPYNWGLILATILIWSIGAIFGYSANANFDMSALINEYTRNLSLLAIAVGFFFTSRRAYILVGVGIGSYLLSFFAQMLSKTLLFQGMVGELAIKPLSIFCFMLLLKHMWILAVDREVNNMADRNAAARKIKKSGEL